MTQHRPDGRRHARDEGTTWRHDRRVRRIRHARGSESPQHPGTWHARLRRQYRTRACAAVRYARAICVRASSAESGPGARRTRRAPLGDDRGTLDGSDSHGVRHRRRDGRTAREHWRRPDSRLGRPQDRRLHRRVIRMETTRVRRIQLRVRDDNAHDGRRQTFDQLYGPATTSSVSPIRRAGRTCTISGLESICARRTASSPPPGITRRG